jgi:hypothetical protein
MRKILNSPLANHFSPVMQSSLFVPCIFLHISEKKSGHAPTHQKNRSMILAFPNTNLSSLQEKNYVFRGLNKNREEIIGAGDGARTHDVQLGKLTFYR